MPIDKDGSVIPSTLGLGSTPSYSDGGQFNDVSIHWGQVQERIETSDPRNRSKKFTEYNVLCQFRGNGGAVTTRLYVNCVMANTFGGVADKEVFTFRADPTVKNSRLLGVGSKVLIACINGETNNAIILNGFRDPADTSEEGGAVKNNGHYYQWIFNGVEISVNDDGEYSVTYRGKTKADGTTDVPQEQTGSSVTFTKDGNVKISDKDGKNAVLIDHANSKVVISRDTALEIGEATDEMLLGKSFRDAQKKMNEILRDQTDALCTAMDSLQKSFQYIATQLASTSDSGVANALVGFDQLAGQFKNASDAFLNIRASVRNFENKAAEKNSFLSEKNKAD